MNCTISVVSVKTDTIDLADLNAAFPNNVYTITLSGLATPYTVGPFIFGDGVVSIGGQFKACATNLATNAFRCVSGTNSPAKLPEYVSVIVPGGIKSSNIDFRAACDLISLALYSPCSVYVNPDGTLATEGERAFGCIKNGFGLGLGGLLLSGGDFPLVVGLLGVLAGPTGCGNVIHLDVASGLLGDLGKLNALKSALGI